MNVAEAAIQLECSTALIYKLCEHGRFGHHRIGFGRGKLSISPAQITEYRRECEVATVPAGEDEPVKDMRRLRGGTVIPDIIGPYMVRRAARRRPKP